MKFPDTPINLNEAEFALNNSKTHTGSAEHVLGHNLLWHEVLTDTFGLNLDDELRTNKRLSGASSNALVDYLVISDPTTLNSCVAEIYANSTAAEEFSAISLSRLEADLVSSIYANPGLIEPAFLIP